MKKFLSILCLCVLSLCLVGCCSCETEPLVQENHKLIVPPNFGNMPK